MADELGGEDGAGAFAEAQPEIEERRQLERVGERRGAALGRAMRQE